MSLTTNLTHYWLLLTNSNDSVGSINGTDTGVSYSSGAVFAANTNHISFGSASNALISGTGDFTLSFSIQRTSGSFVISRRSTFPPNWECFTDGNGINFTDSDTLNLQTGSSISSSEHLYTVTRSGNTFTQYLDGSSLGTTSNSVSLGTGQNLVFGDIPDATGNGALMTLRYVGIWTRALSSGEVSQIWNGGSILFYPFVSGPVNVKTWDGVTQSTGIKTYMGVTVANTKSVDGIT